MNPELKIDSESPVECLMIHDFDGPSGVVFNVANPKELGQPCALQTKS
jgi:hypothetical protein